MLGDVANVPAALELEAQGKKRLAAINEELSSLGTTFGQNVLMTHDAAANDTSNSRTPPRM